jgi:predicted methyltransferase
MLSNEILLLKIIDSNGRISLLRDRGLSHSQVAMLIKKQEDEGNIVVTEEDISLTNQGSKILKENISKIAPRKKDQWILPQEHLYKKPISLDQIVLPKNKKI